METGATDHLSLGQTTPGRRPEAPDVTNSNTPGQTDRRATGFAVAKIRGCRMRYFIFLLLFFPTLPWPGIDKNTITHKSVFIATRPLFHAAFSIAFVVIIIDL